MNRGITIAAVVLALGAFACERKNEQQPSETTTTVRGDQSGAPQGILGVTDLTGAGLMGGGDAGISSKDRPTAAMDAGATGARDGGVTGARDGGVTSARDGGVTGARDGGGM